MGRLRACYGLQVSQSFKNNGDSALMVLCSNQTFASLPPSCPQDAGTYVTGSSQSEDCLFATVYMPQGDAPTGGWPTFVWYVGSRPERQLS